MKHIRTVKTNKRRVLPKYLRYKFEWIYSTNQIVALEIFKDAKTGKPLAQNQLAWIFERGIFPCHRLRAKGSKGAKYYMTVEDFLLVLLNAQENIEVDTEILDRIRSDQNTDFLKNIDPD